jgi:hypothetical protein
VAVYPSLYQARLTKVGATAQALIPQVFGEAPVTVGHFLGSPPVGADSGWVFFIGGNPEFPVWASGTGAGTGPPGPQGPQGPEGPTGPPGVVVVQYGFQWNNKTDVTTTPGSGKIQVNTTNPGVATVVASSLYDRNGQGVFALTRLKVGDLLYLYTSGDISQQVQYTVSGAVVNNGTWVTVPVTVTSVAGFAPTNNTNVETFIPAEAAQDEIWVGSTNPRPTYPTIELWVDTTTTPPVTKAWVSGAWVVTSGSGGGTSTDEVWIGSNDPHAAHPTIEVWIDTSVSPPITRAWISGAWVVTTAPNEVWIGTDDPIAANPTIELWYDSDDDPAATDAANYWNSAWGIVGQGYGTGSDPGITVISDIAGCSVTWTAVAGRRYRTFGTAMFGKNDTAINELVITDGANTTLQQHGAAAQSYHNYAVQFVDNGLPAGPVTRKLRADPAGSGTLTIVNSFNRSAWIVVEDIGPVTKAAVNPPAGQPQIATAGNALGVVAVGSHVADRTLTANTWTQVTNTLSVTFQTGRRYRVSFLLRAMTVSAATANVATNVGLRDGTTFIPDTSGLWQTAMNVVGLYVPVVYSWLLDGDGTTKSLNVAMNPQGSQAMNIYGSGGQNYFYIEDVGPNSSPALPIPDTPPGWTPVTFQNGWVNFDTVRTVQYRKIGDVVTLRGVCKSGTVGYGTPIFTLPVGFRPPTSRNEDWICQASNGPCAISVFDTGVVSVLAVGSSTPQGYSYVNGVSFSVTP